MSNAALAVDIRLLSHDGLALLMATRIGHRSARLSLLQSVYRLGRKAGGPYQFVAKAVQLQIS